MPNWVFLLDADYRIMGLTMTTRELNKKAAYCLGFYHALYDEFQHNPFIDQYYNYYKKGFDDGMRDKL